MKRLYKAEDNVMNYLIIEDTELGKACVFDWDLSEREIINITEKFEKGLLTDAYYNNNEWKPAEEVFDSLFGKELLAYK